MDIWDDMMQPFDEGEVRRDNQEDRTEEDEGGNQEGGNEVQEDKGERDEAISADEEEGAAVKVARAERAPSREEVAMHMVNHIPFRSWCTH